MQKRMLFFIISFMIFSFSAAEHYEEVRCYQVGPGSVYTNYLERSKPWDIHVVAIDLTNPRIRLESVKADDRKLGREVTSSMSRRSDREAHRIVSAVNGDFYNTTNGVPINNQVVNGEFVHAYTYHRSAFTYARNRKAAIVIPAFSGELVAKVDSSGEAVRHPLSTVNRPRYTDYLVIYNRFMGASTGTNMYGTECLARALSGWVVNDTVYAVIESRESGTGDMTIPGDKFVISGHGTAQTFLNEHCGAGDTVKIVQRLEGSPSGLTQLVGGGPRLLENGTEIIAAAAAEEGVGTSFCTARHPRTAVGFNADSTVAYFVVVDGRQDHSAGMSLYELADFMKYIGASHATNLDGGGSSTMTVRSEVKNVPSDGWERIVANAMMCVSTAPDGDLSLIQVERDSIAVYKNNAFELPVSGWDPYYNPREIPSGSGLDISCSEGLGVYDDGVFTVSSEDMDGFIYASLEDSRDSMKVHIIDIDSLTLYPEAVVTDTIRPLDFYVYGCEDGGKKALIDNRVFEFELVNGHGASIDEAGVFTPGSAGEAMLVVRYGADADTAYISIESGSGEAVITELEDSANWELQGENLDMEKTGLKLTDRETGSGRKAFRIDYSTTDDGEIILSTDPVTIYGVPSEFLIDAMSDGLNHRLYIVCEDANGKEYKFKAPGFFNNSEAFVTKAISTDAIIPGDGTEYYPMHLKGIYVDLARGEQSGTLYFDRIRCTYPGWTEVEERRQPGIPVRYELDQNYPNPFNPVTTITYSLKEAAEMRLFVFNISGHLVTVLSEGYKEAGKYSVDFHSRSLPSGVYFYKLQTPGWSDTKKMLLIK